VGLGIRYGQGGYFGVPMAAADLVELVESGKKGRNETAVILDG
jgi:hypothetical protein